MKKITIIFSLLIIGFTSYSSTPVTGIIASNTTWTLANSPYIVTDTIVVVSGYTLTIQPGVVVMFNSKGWIDVRGSFYAKGTASDSIIFTSNSGTPKAGDYEGITIESSAGGSALTYCRLSYASSGLFLELLNDTNLSHCMFTSDLNAISSIRTNIISCTFKYDTLGINMPSGITIEGCTFLYNGTALLQSQMCTIIYDTFQYNNIGIERSQIEGIRYCIINNNRYYGVSEFSDTVSNCEIEYNKTGIESQDAMITQNYISNNTIGIKTEIGDSIYCNSICNNTNYNLVLGSSYNENAKDNYWCLTDSAQIQATIYDIHQNLSLGFVYFMPFNSKACSGTPSAINEIKANDEEVRLFPNPNNGKFNIELNGANEKTVIKIYNILGENIYQTILYSNTTEINLSAQPQGMYLYRVMKGDGSLVGEGKVIIDK